MRVNCVNGLLQGKGVLCGLVPQYGIYNNLPLSECNFENGEIIGVCKQWDLNSINFEIRKGKILCLEDEYDYFELRKKLEFSEFTYVKGSSTYVRWTTYQKNNSTGQLQPTEHTIAPKNTRW